ncbi:MAG: sigma-70 family RNA polymerase sigma factor [Candidatus Azobacteroides sp.]|nr:sigma-70 family RNA polymerase sigma factor [Candidatus Azobacteroides sp.]
MKNPNDLFYIQRVKAGDIRAFSMIVSNYQKMVFTIVLKIVENREDAEDITQEIFVKVFKSLERFKEESEFSTWLYRIAYNTTISELRKRKLSFVPMDDNSVPVNEAVTDEEELEPADIKLHYLDVALKKLPPDEIFLVSLYYFKEQSIEAISEISNLSVANVKVKLYRIRKKLALEINRLLQDEDK